MKTKRILRHTRFNVCFIIWLLGATLSTFAQCPTIDISNPAPICDASGLTISHLDTYATETLGGGIVWYDTDTGGTALNSNQLLSEGTYYVDNSLGNCPTPRQSVTISFQLEGTGLTFIAISTNYCSNQTPTYQTYINDVIQSHIPIGGSVDLYEDVGLMNVITPSTSLPNFDVFYIVFTDNSGLCKSQIESARTIVITSAEDPTPNSLQEFCSDTNPIVASLDTGTTEVDFNWYDNATASGSPLLLTDGLVDGNMYYIQVEDLSSGCHSNPVPVTVNIDTPISTGTSATLQYCEDNLPIADFNLFDELGAADPSGTWSGPTGITISNGNLGTVNISGQTPGVYVFTYTLPANGACPSGSSTVTINVDEILSPGTPSLTVQNTFCITNTLSNFNLFTLLDNEDAGGQWTEGTLSTDPVVSSTISLTGLAIGTYNYTYTQNVLPNLCAEASTTVQVEIIADPNVGLAINETLCENNLVTNSPFDLFTTLDGSQDNNGVWRDANNVIVTNPIDISSLTLAGSPYEYTYTIDNGACIGVETISIIIEDAPESGTPVTTFPEFCQNDTTAIVDLFSLLTGEDTNGTWYEGIGVTGALVLTPGAIDLTSASAQVYNYTYSVSDIGACSDPDVTVQITINPLPNTGIPIPTAQFCENNLVSNSPINLFDQLTGEDSGGTWTEDDTTGLLTGSNIDITGLAIGSYDFTYSINDANGCENSSTVTIIVDDAPESGTSVAAFPEFCQNDTSAIVDLFSLLIDEDTNGTWYEGIGVTGAVVLTPDAIDLTSASAQVYNYTYSVSDIGVCSDPDVTVQITINPLPNTGTPMSVTFCENDLVSNSPINLFDQITGEDTGGTWTEEDTTGLLTGSNADITGLTIGLYDFTYSVNDANGCENSSTVTISVTDTPESGTANTPIEFCITDIAVGETYDLFDLLTGEDQTGVWTDDNATGLLIDNIVTLDGLAASTYNFTYNVNAIGSCDDMDITVQITINETPAPITTPSQEFCDAATVSDLVAIGNTIQWYDDTTGGTALAGTTALVTGETYYATQTDATTGCESSLRTEVIATIYQSPNAGNLNATAILACNDNNSIDLNLGLDGSQDTGGVWQDTSLTGALSGNVFDATGIVAGTYQFTYYIAASSPCIDASTTITVTINEPLNPGTDSTLDICSDNGTTDLFTLLGTADTGGTWDPVLTSGTGIFDPLLDAQGTYTYSLTNACGNFTSDVVVSVTQAANAGNDNSISICVIDGVIDLFSLLGTSAQTGGTWSPALTSGTGTFDPNIDTAGVYIYTVLAQSPCSTDSSAQITVVVNDTSAPIVINATPEFCLVDNPTVANLDDSLTLVGTTTWYDDAALTMPLNTSENLIDGKDYFATQTSSSGCESSVSIQVTVTVNDTPTPTLIDLNQELCINDDPIINDLTLNITEYDATSDNVVWYDAAVDGSIVSSSSILENSVTYYAALIDPITGCESSVRLELIPDLTSCGDIILPDGFSPNGDGVNDTYDYNNVDILYPNFEMEIYNRNGNIVYKGNANSPRFDGTSNQPRTIIKGDLPVGVYFYIFNFNDGETEREQGRLYLSR